MSVSTQKVFSVLAAWALATLTAQAAPEKYSSNWDSLRKHEVPQWAKDAKFGIYAHWGIYSVAGAWDLDKNWANDVICSYQGVYHPNPRSGKRREFEKHIGALDKGFGYKDLAMAFQPTQWDPSYWADLIQKSGAKYAGICAIHHDGYAMWDSDVIDFCATKTGPKRDLLGDILTEIKKRGLKTMTSFHHARTYKQYQGIKKRAVAKKANYMDLLNPELSNYYWFMGDQDSFTKTRYELTKEVIDKYKPDTIWFDGRGGKFGTEAILADFFNMAEVEDKEVSVHNKGNFGNDFGVYSYENGHARPAYINWPWEDDTPSAVGWCDWPWQKGMEYKKPRDVVVRLCDLVARNGGLLLSMNPKPDGTLEKGQVDLLEGIGSWLAQNGEAIYSTVPWKIYAEGHLGHLEYFQYKGGDKKKPSRGIQPDPKRLDATDVRFTRNGENLYATMLGIPSGGKAKIKTLARATKISEGNKIASVELLGHGPVKWERSAEALIIELPDTLPNDWALSFKINVKDELDKSAPDTSNTKMRLPKKT